MSQVPARIARIGAVTAKTPVLISAAATAATAKVIDWELRQLARSPLTAEARRLDRHYRELAARPRPRAGPGKGGRPGPPLPRAGRHATPARRTANGMDGDNPARPRRGQMSR